MSKKEDLSKKTTQFNVYFIIVLKSDVSDISTVCYFRIIGFKYIMNILSNYILFLLLFIVKEVIQQ